MKFVVRFSILTLLVLCSACLSSKKNFLGLDDGPANRDNTPSGFAADNTPLIAINEEENQTNEKVKVKKSFEKGEYQRAIEELKEDLEDDPESPVTNYYLAEAYRKSNRIYEAGNYYAKAMEGGHADDEIALHYARSLKVDENYVEAKRVLQNYLEHAKTEKLIEKAKTELKNLDKLDSIKLDLRKISVSPAVVINTSHAEYSPYYFDGHLYFSSTRETENIFKGNGTGFSDLFKIKTSGLIPESGTLEPLEDFINEQGINEGTIAFSPDGSTLVFAKGNSGKKGGRQDVDLFISEKRNGKWRTPRPMPINSPDWESSPVFNRSGTTIYFASNRPGGVGGIDIWRTSKNERGRWANVVNLGTPINTPENEMFPYVSEDAKLYFSSDGHPGLGMLDLFEAVNKGGEVTIRNLGASINTAYDDFGLVYSLFPYEGFFASNRPGGQGDDDIYTFVDDSPHLKKVQYVLKGTTYSLNQDSTRTILEGVRVTLNDATGQLIDDMATGSGGTFEFSLEPEKTYTLLGKKLQYLAGRNTLSTVGETVDKSTLTVRSFTKEFAADLDLTEIEKIEGRGFVMENVFYDLAKWDIRPDAARELDKLVQFMKDNPAVSIELSSHTDSRAEDDFNLELSQKRAQSAVDYMASKGIQPSRMTAKGYGETQLVNGCSNEVDCTEEQHQQNRRTEFKITNYDSAKDGN